MMVTFFVITRLGRNIIVTKVQVDLNNVSPDKELENAINVLTGQSHMYVETIKVS